MESFLVTKPKAIDCSVYLDEIEGDATYCSGPPHEVYLECESKDKEIKISAQRPFPKLKKQTNTIPTNLSSTKSN